MYILLSWPMALPAPYPFAGKSWTIVLLTFSHTHIPMPVLLLLIVYFRIFRSLDRRRSELFRLAASISTMTLRHTLERERKMASTSLMILILFCASFLPFYIKIQILNFCKCLDSIQKVFRRCSYFSVLIFPYGSFFVRLEGTKVSAIVARVPQNQEKKCCTPDTLKQGKTEPKQCNYDCHKP